MRPSGPESSTQNVLWSHPGPECDYSPVMILLFRYFWFVCAAFLLLNILIWRSRVPALVDRGVISVEEGGRFIRVALVGLCGPTLLLGIISLAAGWSDPFCSQGLSFADLPSAAAAIVTVASQVVALAWVWFGSGAQLLGRVAPVLARRRGGIRQYSPRAVRIAVTLLAIVSLIGGRLQPPPVNTRTADSCLVPRLRR